MTPKTPWSVKGVDPEAREAAKMAARKAGVTVGVWLNQTIRIAASQQLKSGFSEPLYPPPPGPGYAHPGYDPSSSPPPGATQPPALTLETVLKNIQNLSAKIQETEDRTAEAIAPISSRIQELARQMDDVRNQDGPAVAPVERALGRLAERLEKLEHAGHTGQARDAPTASTGFLSRIFGK